MKNVNKYFPGVHALINVNFDLKKGEVHALLGENGAGKSTLINVLGGIYKIDKGEIYISGEKKVFNTVMDAKECGINIIHQELVLVPHMTVAENIFLAREFTTKLKLVDKKKMNVEAKKMLDEFEMDIDPKTLVGSLTMGQQQMIEIISAVSVKTQILVMDEPTSSLSEKEVEVLFNTVRRLKEIGVGIIYISHRMSELKEIADRVTVIRDGQYIGTKIISETQNDELVSMMVGRSLTNYYTRTYNKMNDVVLEVKNITRKGVVDDVSFTLRKGEILGFAGLIGAGRTETLRCVLGLDKYESGEIFVNGRKVTIKGPNDAMSYGIALVPENRRKEGLFLIMDVKFNISFRIMDKFIKGCWVNKNVERQIVEQYVKELSIKTSSIQQKVGNLSGGNQQKVVVAKWLAAHPKVLILDEPTRGIDVGAKSEIYHIMNELAKQGVAIIMISSELPEIINMSDRVVVMGQGKVKGILKKDELSQERIMHYAVGGQ
jgi:ribose transport system ATP-binding protein/inositol transport system ATP-binding protein